MIKAEKLALLKLLKCYEVEEPIIFNEYDGRALRYGLVISAAADEDIIDNAIKLFGKDGALINKTFHKSWNKVENSSLEELIFEQILHYITTYGYEAIGQFDSSKVYWPEGVVDVPELNFNEIKLIPILPKTTEQITEELTKLVTSGIALNVTTINSCIDLFDKYLDTSLIKDITNKELRIALFEKYGLTPEDPIDFLRYLIFKLTGETLIIQNQELIEKLRLSVNSKKEELLKLLSTYINNYGEDKLSSIFLRYKKLFLALKIKYAKQFAKKVYTKVDNKFVESTTNVKTIGEQINTIINRLRKKADLNHKPFKAALLDRLTTISIDELDIIRLNNEIKNATTFRLTRVYNMINFRLISEDKSTIYKVRNGKAYIKSANKVKSKDVLLKAKDLVFLELVERIKSKIGDKVIYLPEYINYVMPTTEKQFIGEIPSGSYVKFKNKDSLLVGVTWYNFDDQRVDLDLSCSNVSSYFGWHNWSYRNDDSTVVFSGDCTDANSGASEVFKFNLDKLDGRSDYYNINLNLFVGPKNVPFDLILAKRSSNYDFKNEKHTAEKFMIDPNNILNKFSLAFKDDERQKCLGVVQISKDYTKFIYGNLTIGAQSRVARSGKFNDEIFDVTCRTINTQLMLVDLLRAAGVYMLTTNKVYIDSDKEAVDIKDIYGDKLIDLSPETINKTTFINLFA